MAGELEALLRKHVHKINRLVIDRTWSGDRPIFQASFLPMGANGFYKVEHHDDPVTALLMSLRSLEGPTSQPNYISRDAIMERSKIEEAADEFF